MQTPWGVSERVKRIHPDIILVTTPRHGGIHVGGKTAEKIPQDVGVPSLTPMGGQRKTAKL